MPTTQKSIMDILPRILMFDDILGADIRDNLQRKRYCRLFRLKDVSPGEHRLIYDPSWGAPVAEIVFHRGQKVTTGQDGRRSVENFSEQEIVEVVGQYWDIDGSPSQLPISFVLLDLHFKTGKITSKSEQHDGKDTAEGCADDVNPYFGYKIAETICEHFPNLVYFFLTHEGGAEGSENMKGNVDEVRRIVEPAAAHRFLPKFNTTFAQFKEALDKYKLVPDPEEKYAGMSKATLLVLRQARRGATGFPTILLRGEPGTGKTDLASYIHLQSARPGKFEKSEGCGDSLDELEGSKKGAYSGSVETRKGAFQSADKGTLFIDEFCKDVKSDQVVRLLRLLGVSDTKRIIKPAGSDQTIPCDVKVVLASNEELETKLPRDLLARVSGMTITVPPLRERLSDIPYLIRSWSLHHGEGREIRVSPEALALIKRYTWPDNIRELRLFFDWFCHDYPDAQAIHPTHFNRWFAAPGSCRVMPDHAPVTKVENENATDGIENKVKGPAEFCELMEQCYPDLCLLDDSEMSLKQCIALLTILTHKSFQEANGEYTNAHKKLFGRNACPGTYKVKSFWTQQVRKLIESTFPEFLSLLKDSSLLFSVKVDENDK